MKKFRFSLQTLKDYRQQELDRQKNALAALQSELRRINEETEELRRRVTLESEQLNEISRRGAQAYDIALRKRYIVTLQAEIHFKEQQELQKQGEIDRQLNVVVEATKDVKTLEKLEEKQLEEYKAAEGKENELFIEEFVSGGAVRGAIAAQK